MRRTGRRLAIWMGAILLGIVLFLTARLERVLDAVYALRTGYDFVWMPEGVIPFANRPLNSSGQVAVDVQQGCPHAQAAIWSLADPTARLLGTLPGYGSDSNASAINERGSVVGFINAAPWVALHAYFWSIETGMVEIPALGPGTIHPASINNKDEVVGTTPKGRVSRGFLWDPRSGTRELAPLVEAGESFAVGINEQGWIAGNSTAPDGQIHPVLWKPGEPVQDIGIPPGYVSGAASKINERGEMLVNLSGPGSKYGDEFIWSGAKGYAALPVPAGFKNVMAFSLNNLGHVLLSGESTATQKYAGFLVVNGEVKQLPSARLGLQTRYNGLNDRGWLTGYVELQDGGGPDLKARRGFVARP